MIPRWIPIVAACVRFGYSHYGKLVLAFWSKVRHLPNTTWKSRAHFLLLFNTFSNGEQVALFSSVDVEQKRRKEAESKWPDIESL